MKIKTGDTVRILTGKDRGKEGEVIQVFPTEQRVVVEGINLATRHLRSRSRDQQGQKIEFPAPVDVSNVAYVDTKTGKTGRIGYKFIDKDGAKKKVRVLRTAGEELEIE